jgi:hypothetical protein
LLAGCTPSAGFTLLLVFISPAATFQFTTVGQTAINPKHMHSKAQLLFCSKLGKGCPLGYLFIFLAV